jgi:hypothetical protein
VRAGANLDTIGFRSCTCQNTLFGLTFPVAASILIFAFTIGAAANAMRAILMKTSGQRIIARVRCVAIPRQSRCPSHALTHITCLMDYQERELQERASARGRVRRHHDR